MCRRTSTYNKRKIKNGQHAYEVTVKWTGDKGKGTFNYKSYERNHTISVENKSDILGSSDPAFRGDKNRHNPEELFVASLSSCHMLWYLHLCAEAGVTVVEYIDRAAGTMVETADGGGCFTEVILYPAVKVTEATMIEKANELHSVAQERCFIANSVNFPVHHKPTCKVAEKR